MRFTILLFFIALLPVMMLAHWWEFEERQQPALLAQVQALLEQAGVREAHVELRYLDLAIAGDAPDEAAVQEVTRQIQQIGALRLRSNHLRVPAKLKARLEGQELVLEGWLPDAQAVDSLTRLLAETRPDLRIAAQALRVSPLVRLPAGEKTPFEADSPMLAPILSSLHVPSSLEIRREAGQIVASGLIPDEALRRAIVEAVSSGPHGLPVEAEGLRVSSHALPAPFTSVDHLVPLLHSFYSTLSPGEFRVRADENPHFRADATRSLESEWLTRLRPLTQGRRAELELDHYPSTYHFPGRRLQTPLPPDVLQTVEDALAGQFFLFSPGQANLSSEQEARLANLVPVLLSAGPALRLIVGGHPDPTAAPEVESRLARQRAEQVVSFLIEQGAPSVEILPVAFDPVPLGGKHAPSQTPSVEILIQ